MSGRRAQWVEKQWLWVRCRGRGKALHHEAHMGGICGIVCRLLGVQDCHCRLLALWNITHFLIHRFPTSSGKSFTNICHLVRNGQGEEMCFVSTFSELPRSETLTPAFAAGGREDFISALTGRGSFLLDPSRDPDKEQLHRLMELRNVLYFCGQPYYISFYSKLLLSGALTT